MKKVFIDGREGTTGLRIFERLNESGLELIALSEGDRKNSEKRKEALNEAGIVFLCLPDDAAREAVSMLSNPDTVVIDASTAHRTSEGWAYGFPELSQFHRENIKTSKRIAVPGCHASGFIALIYPLISNGLIDRRALLSCCSLTGYSGGGKRMIAEYENEKRHLNLDSPRQYGIMQTHKHLKEMSAVCGLDNPPCFMPVVAPFYSGMEVTVPLFRKSLLKNADFDDIKEIYKSLYNTTFVKYCEEFEEGGFLTANAYSGRDSMQIGIFGNEDRAVLVARFDNLGKGASGAAIQCMNIALSRDEGFKLIP